MVTRSQSPRWTHPSVKKLPKLDQDPIRAIVQRARNVTMEAMDQGWSGPPFNPIALAQFLGIEIEPREDIPEARTIALGKNKFRIEFNPIRPDARIRFSIAHEIAHTFFSDCADQIRNRDDKESMTSDDWQLEMLCNIAAAELIMPIGSFPDLRNETLSIDRLMEVRRLYEVSIEALLLRFINLTPTPCALFAASRAESGEDNGRYRIDYAIRSSSWKGNVPVGSYLREGTIAAGCTAIGYTAKGDEFWPPNQKVWIECVGAPPYPGRSFPRVLGFVVDSDESYTRQSIKYLIGNALDPRGEMPIIIAHVVNDKATTWGGGIAKQIAIKYSDAQIDFRKWSRDEDNMKLGRVHFYGAPRGVEIASMIAQHGFGFSKQPRIRYPELQRCLTIVADRAIKNDASVHMPRIGCGQAGGTWSIVEELIEQELTNRNVQVTVYDLPHGRRNPPPQA